MRRVLVVGMSGAGKTTAARAVAEAIGAPFHEMDGLYHGPGWTVRDDFAAVAAAIVAEPAWVIDSWGYEPARTALWAAADTVVWLDYPARIVLSRLARRSLGRTLRRERIFGGNRETLRQWFGADHPLWYAARNFRARRAALGRLTAQRPGLRTVRFAHPAELDRWIAAGCLR